MSEKRIWSLKLSWLAAFVFIAKVKNQSEAASRLGCDQSTISRYLRNLQTWLNKDLVKSVTPFELTEYGAEFLPVALDVLSLLLKNVNMDQAELAKQINDDAHMGERALSAWR